MSASMLLPGDVDQAVQDRLAAKLDGVNVGSIGDLNTDEGGELVFDPPCARTFYASGRYDGGGDNQALTYDDSAHLIDIWVAEENLISLEAQRRDTLSVVARVLPVIAGARLTLGDGSQTEPVRLLGVQGSLQKAAGAPIQTVYIVSIEVPGVAQFPAHEAGE